MSHKYDQLLHSIMHGPTSANIHWRDVESLLHHLGASIETGHGARMNVVLNGVEGSIHKPHHSGTCGKNEIRHLRDFLASAGVHTPVG